MYLSKIIVNPLNKSIIDNLDNSNFWHKKVMEGFIDYMEPISSIRKKLGILFRLKFTDKQFCIYVQSKVEPNWYGLSWIKKADVKDMTDLLNSFYEGQILNFETLTLPYRTLDKKVVPIIDIDGKLDWFKEKQKYNGFEIYNDYLYTEYTSDKFTNIGGHKEINYCATLFKGKLIITDVTKFKEFYISGFGRQKAYGAGMLLLF